MRGFVGTFAQFLPLPSESHSEAVTVALVGDPKSPPPGSADWELGWSGRPQATLDVDEETTLAEILDRAGEAFGAEPFIPLVPLSEIVHWIAFEDDSGQPLRARVQTSLTLLDDDGRAVWNVRDWGAVPFGQLRRSARAGVIDGDPQRIYLIRQVPQGDAGLTVESWRVFLELLAIARDGFGRAGDLGEKFAGLAFLVVALRKGLRTVRRLHGKWAQRGAKPMDLADVLPGAETDAELARRLACTEEDAAAVRELLKALEVDDPLVRSFRRALTEADSVSRSMYDYQAMFRIRVEELQAGRDEPEPILLERMAIDLHEWERDRFEFPPRPSASADDVRPSFTAEDDAQEAEEWQSGETNE